jgi:murein DD-endopeptidase MepM/ murein hydrolase activator NlpD
MSDATDIGSDPMEEITVRASRLTGPSLQSPVPGGQIRGIDPRYGSGAFGASRDGGKRTHEGVDLLADPGTSAVAPLTGKVTYIGNPYKPDVIAKNPALGNLQFVQITDENGNHAQVHYVTPSVKFGDKVVAGQTPIGTVQNLNPAYPGIPNHVHLQLLQGRDKVNPTPYLVNPTPYLSLGQEMVTAK